MQLEYVTWSAPDLPPVAIRRPAMEGIHREVNDTFASAPHRGAETGGILLGRREDGRIVIEDFEPIPSDHRFGPSYQLSETDRALLRETLEWFRGGAQPGLSVLGLYRSHTPEEFELCQEDEDLMRAYFLAGEDLVLLVRPNLMESSDADFAIRRCGLTEPPAPPPALMSWPAPRPRLNAEPERPVSKNKRWRWIVYTGAALLGLAAGALSYRWWHPDAGIPRIAAAAPAPAPAAQPIVEGTPLPPDSTPPATDTSGIHELLDRWAGALKRGDVDAAARCYAPVVATYFDRHDVTRDAVRQSIRQAQARYGRPEIYRISGLGVTPVTDTRAVATFRKHWQWHTSRNRRSSGEEEERITLVRTADAWHISSEQAVAR